MVEASGLNLNRAKNWILVTAEDVRPESASPGLELGCLSTSRESLLSAEVERSGTTQTR